MRFIPLPIILLAMPLVEITGFVLVGKAVGLWSTLALVILSFVVGMLLLRRQGLSIIRQVRTLSRTGQPPDGALFKPVMRVIAALLLILPGFFTDIVALLFLVPAVQNRVWQSLSARIVVNKGARSKSGAGPTPPAGKVVDLDEGDFHREPNPQSPWSGKRLGDQ